MYLYVPYRNQDDLPVFDTARADLNLVQLFRTNRYVGADRLSNANQVSVGVTSRLLDADTGKQFISATIGQAYYFDEPRVALPGEVARRPRDLRHHRGAGRHARIGDWNVGMGVQWDPGETRSEKGDVQLQYQPDVRPRGRISAIASGATASSRSMARSPGRSATQWSAYARMVYSLEDKTSLDQFAGLEYRSCCWRLRAVARRYVSNRDRRHGHQRPAAA